MVPEGGQISEQDGLDLGRTVRVSGSLSLGPRSQKLCSARRLRSSQLRAGAGGKALGGSRCQASWEDAGQGAAWRKETCGHTKCQVT